MPKRRFYVEVAYGLAGATAQTAEMFRRAGEVEYDDHDELEGKPILTYDTGLGAVVVGMTFNIAGDRYSAASDALYALGEGLEVGLEAIQALLLDKGMADDVEVLDPHTFSVTHPDGLLEAMRSGAEGLAARKLPDSHDSGEGAAA